MDNNNNYLTQEEEEVSIDWMALVNKALKRWKIIAGVTFVFSVLGLVYALFIMQRIYTVSVTLAPEVQTNRNSSLGGIASMLGLGTQAMGIPTEAMNITTFPEICESTPFLTSLYSVKLTPYLNPKDALNGAQQKPDVTLYDHLMRYDDPDVQEDMLDEDYQEEWAEYCQFYDDTQINVSRLTPNQANVLEILIKWIDADVDKKTGVTTVTVTLDDPLMVTQLADTVTARLQKYVEEYRTRKAIDDYEYYVEQRDSAKANLAKAQLAYAAVVDYDRSVSLQSVLAARERLQQDVSVALQLYQQMASQADLAKIKIQESKPVYAVIQPASMPQKAANSRAKVCIIWFFLGFFLSTVWVTFAKDFLQTFWADFKAKRAAEGEGEN